MNSISLIKSTSTHINTHTHTHIPMTYVNVDECRIVSKSVHVYERKYVIVNILLF